MAKSGSKGPAPGEDDAALWRMVTRDVKPIGRANAVRPPADSADAIDETPKAAKKTSGEAPRRGAPSRPPARPSAAPPSPLSHGQAAGVDRRTLDRLRRGQLAIEAEIDLHGYRQDEAHGALTRFIAGQAGAGRRCVRVVTGRGVARDGGGVLKSAVPGWLNEPPLRDSVLAFAHARPADGGDGALYVLLRRRRPKPDGE